MRALAILPLISLPLVQGIPASEFQTVLNEIGDISDFTGGLFGGIAKGIGSAAKQAEKIFHGGQEKVEKWVEKGKEFVKQNGLTCTYRLRFYDATRVLIRSPR